MPEALSKITPPRIYHTFERLRVHEKLDQARGQAKVIWISSPAGSGKTTLISSYLKSRKIKPIWLQIDNGDNDLASFYYYLGQAAAILNPKTLSNLPTLSAEYLHGITVFSRNYFRQLLQGMKKNNVLVFDNLQDISNPEVFVETILPGLSEITSQTCCFIISREPPAKCLSRMQINGELIHFDWNDIRFNETETEQFLLHEGIELSESLREILFALTGGWVVGLRLLAEQRMSIQDSDILSLKTNQQVFDYFLGELFVRMSSEQQEFLIKTSVLSRIEPDAANKLTGRIDAEKILHDMANKNLFLIQYSINPPVYQYHALYREFLLYQLSERLSLKLISELKKCAADLLLNHDKAAEAIELYLQISHWDDAIKAIEIHAEPLLKQGRYSLLSDWITNLPHGLVSTNSALLLMLGECSMAMNLDKAREYYEKAYQVSKEHQDIPVIVSSWCGAVLTYAYAWSHYQGLDVLIEDIDEISRSIQEHQLTEMQAMFESHVFIALMLRQPQSPLLTHYADRVWDLIVHQHNPQIIMLMTSHLLNYLTWWRGDINRSSILIDILSRSQGENGTQPLIVLTGKTILSSYLTTIGNHDECIAAVDDAINIAESQGIHTWDIFLCTSGTMASLSINDLERAELFLSMMLSCMDETRILEYAVFYYLKSVFELHCGMPERAKEYAIIAEQKAAQAGCPFYYHVILTQYARMQLYSGDEIQGRNLIANVLEFGRKTQLDTICFLAEFALADFAIYSNEPQQALSNMKAALGFSQPMNLFMWPSSNRSRLFELLVDDNTEPQYAYAAIKQCHMIPHSPLFAIDSWPYSIKLICLGQFALYIDNKHITSSGKAQKKPLELLKTLIAFGGKEVSIDRLCEILWPDADGDNAYQSFKMALKRLRDLIQYKEALVLTEGKLSLDPRYVWLDVWAVDHAKLSNAVEDKQTALGLYKGAFLENEPPQAWMLVTRERLRNQFIQLVQDVADAYQQDNDWPAVITTYQRGLEVDPLVERFCQGLLHAYQHTGERTEAIRAYKYFEEQLDTQLGIKPSAKTNELFQEIKAG